MCRKTIIKLVQIKVLQCKEKQMKSDAKIVKESILRKENNKKVRFSKFLVIFYTLLNDIRVINRTYELSYAMSPPWG